MRSFTKYAVSPNGPTIPFAALEATPPLLRLLEQMRETVKAEVAGPFIPVPRCAKAPNVTALRSSH